MTVLFDGIASDTTIEIRRDKMKSEERVALRGLSHIAQFERDIESMKILHWGFALLITTCVLMVALAATIY